jgi:plasmid stabilization system protein ParE
MAVDILWTKRAEKKFEKILEFLSNEWGTQVTKAFIKEIYDFMDLLSEFPEMGSVENKKLGIRGFVVVKQVSVFYRIKENKVIILNFFDNRKNPKKKRF